MLREIINACREEWFKLLVEEEVTGDASDHLQIVLSPYAHAVAKEDSAWMYSMQDQTISGIPFSIDQTAQHDWAIERVEPS